MKGKNGKIRFYKWSSPSKIHPVHLNISRTYKHLISPTSTPIRQLLCLIPKRYKVKKSFLT